MAITAAQILTYAADEQVDLFHEGLEAHDYDQAVELARRFRLAVERGYLVVDDTGVIRLTSLAQGYLAQAC